MPKLEKFLEEREKDLQTAKAEPIYLFPNPSIGEPYRGDAIRSTKDKVAKIAGISFQLKDF